MKLKTTIILLTLISSLMGFVAMNQDIPMVRVNIIFDGQIDNQLLDRLDAELHFQFSSFPGVSVSIPQTALSLLDKIPFIKWEYDYEVRLLEDSIDWGVDRIDAERVWGGAENAVDVTTGVCGTNVRVAVIDTGIDQNHPDLNVYGGYDFVNNDNNPYDDHGHGTHVAGTIAALDNDLTGSLVGVAPCVRLYAVKVLSASGSGTSSAIAAGLEWAADNGMHIASLSLGSSSPSSVIQQAGQYAASRGVLLVAASGNDNGPVGYPAAFSEFMAVGATDSSDRRASFSNYGSQLEIAAPGVSIRSTYPGNTYRSLSGTSMATPHVSAVAALVKSANPSLTAGQIRQILRNTAEDLGSAGWDQYFGYGLVDAQAAVAAAGGGGGGDTFQLRFESYDWDIANEVDVIVNGNEVNWESQGLAGNNQFKTFTLDVSAYVTSVNSFTVTFIDNYGNYNNDIRNVQLLENGVVYQTWQTSWAEPDGNGLTYSTGGGGGGDTWTLSIYTYDWDISNEASIYVNGIEMNWVSQGLAANNGYKTYTFDISSIANGASTLTIFIVDNYGSYTNYFTNLVLYRNGATAAVLESSWVEPNGNGVTYTYNI